jgi:hypothetical protein
MSAKANYFKLGLFIIVAVVLGVIGVLVLGAGKLFEKRIILETYLNESVQGVDIGSKVKFRGVPVGNIRRIDFTRNRYEQEKMPLQRRSYVRIEMEMSADALGAKTETIVNEDLPREIQNGLRVRLTALGVTGTSYLEVDYLDPGQESAVADRLEAGLSLHPVGAERARADRQFRGRCLRAAGEDQL